MLSAITGETEGQEPHCASHAGASEEEHREPAALCSEAGLRQGLVWTASKPEGGTSGREALQAEDRWCSLDRSADSERNGNHRPSTNE